MADKKKGKVIEITDKTLKRLSDALKLEPKSYEVTSGSIKDQFCNYGYEILHGIGAGDTVNIKGGGIIDDDLQNAFNKFNVHMAVIDGVYEDKGVDVEDIDKLHVDDITLLFNVTGFQIKGGEGNESIILTGTKYVHSVAGRMEIKSPKIPLDSLSSYKWHNELKAAADNARNEVALYKEGKCTAVAPQEPAEDPNQLKIELSGKDDDLESSKV